MLTECIESSTIATMSIHHRDKGCWTEISPRASASLMALAFVSAALALLLPGQVGETAGIASILGLGALALAAGHRWGLWVVLLADIAMVGNAWPIVNSFSTFDRHWWLASGALAAALPGALFMTRRLPSAASSLVGARSRQSRRFASVFASVGLAVWVAAPTLTGSGFQSRPMEAAKPVVNASAKVSVAKSRSIAPVTTNRPLDVTVPSSTRVISPSDVSRLISSDISAR